MKLEFAHTATQIVSRIAKILLEDGEAPTWKFTYGNYHNDPHPDILLLGSYRHPSTGNNLVGGVNLHYLSSKEKDDLARVLPQIMSAKNLYDRYHLGRDLVPSVFDNNYRTYNQDHIQGLTQDVMYPKYGFLKTAANAVKKTLGKLNPFKSREQKQQEAEPHYPSDLSNMHDRLSQAIAQVQKQEPEPPDTPEMQNARKAFLKFRSEQNAPTQRNVQNDPMQQVFQQINQERNELEDPYPEPRQPTIRDIGQDIETDYQENQRELQEPEIEDPLDPTPDVNLENVIYYSPKRKCYIMESFGRRRQTSPFLQLLESLRPEFCIAAQEVYDDWDQEMNYGGICDEIEQAISGVLGMHGIDSTLGGQDGDDHAYTVAFNDSESYIIDIPYHIYEHGSGFAWSKIEGVQFIPDHIEIYQIDHQEWNDLI